MIIVKTYICDVPTFKHILEYCHRLFETFPYHITGYSNITTRSIHIHTVLILCNRDKKEYFRSFLIIEWYTHSLHFTIKRECEKSLMCAQVYTYAQLCSDKNTNKKDNSLLDLFGLFSQSLIQWLVSQQINRLPHVNFVLPNSCVNIL